MGCRILIHKPVKVCSSWEFRAIPGYYTGPALHHYCCFTVFPSSTRTPQTSNTVEFRHHYITVPTITPEDRVISAIAKLKQELASIPSPKSEHQLSALYNRKTLFSKYKESSTSTSTSNKSSLDHNQSCTSSHNSNTYYHSSPLVDAPYDLANSQTHVKQSISKPIHTKRSSAPRVDISTNIFKIPKSVSVASRT